MKLSVVALLVLIFGVLMLYACSPKTQQKLSSKSVEEAPKEAPADEAEEPVSIMNPTGSKATTTTKTTEQIPPTETVKKESELIQLVASLKKTPCYGKCPVYELKFYSDGTASYTGKSFVDRIGDYKAKVSKEKMAAIAQQATACNYFDLSENYPSSKIGIPDLPNTITYLKLGDREKQIFNNHAAPKALLDYEKFVEGLIEQLNWEKIETTN